MLGDMTVNKLFVKRETLKILFFFFDLCVL